MKVSLQWLKRYLELDLSVERISELLTGCGLEVESTEIFESVKGSLEGVFTGKVVTCIKHPNADKLSVTTVDIGSGSLLNIVCGAPNVAQGQLVLVATVGTMVYKGSESFQIREAKIRGELSQGMICAEDELGLGESHDGIMVLPDNVPIGIKASDYFKVYKDTVFEIGLTPNRSDAFSHTGVARDLIALINVHHLSDDRKQLLKWPDVSNFKPDDDSFIIPVTVEDSKDCPRYCGLTFTDVKIGPSPEWMQNLLKAAGMRPINNVVDITNFVLLECGQPLHAFDADKITGNEVIVKKLVADSLFTTLDGIERKLNGTELMICNAVEGMCMAGVYGGLNSGITDSTSRIFLESAYFNPVSIRKTSRYHGLKTDSSQRFERGANPDMAIYAMKRAALLLQEYAGARITSSIQDIYPEPVQGRSVSVNYSNIDKLIGKSIPRDTIKSILQNLEIVIESESAEGLQLSVPPFKVDVEREADIVEEVLRIYGYNNIELSDEIKYSMNVSHGNKKETIKDLLAGHLCSHGFSEIMSNSLTRADYTTLLKDVRAESYVRIINPLSKDLEFMRRTMLFGGLEAIVHNYNRKTHDLKLFEFGSVYCYSPDIETNNPHERYSEDEIFSLWVTGNINPENWQEAAGEINFFYLKSMIISLLHKAGVQKHQYEVRSVSSSSYSEGLEYYLPDNSILLDIGQLDGSLLKAFDIKMPVYYASIRLKNLMALLDKHKVTYSELPRYPWVRRDLALLLDIKTTYSEIEQLAFETEISLIKKVNLFDIYEGEKIGPGKKSYAVSFILQDAEKTLTDEQIDAVMNRLIKKFKDKLGAVIR
ncbi:MAG: phenylalanine--tRNA ligase subunit beta [Bacteroidales bacterium]